MKADKTLQERLLVADYSRKTCLAGLNGEAVPYALGDPIHRLCTIRGIRYHASFGEELRSLLPEFTRALNARAIMSNEMPKMDLPEEIPYCIWQPEIASEHTYRQLVRDYPNLAYQVGHACAVAGYTDLYEELDILPDVHVAEEARECGNLAIYEMIMSAPARYDIMDDYNRRVNPDNRKVSHLNGDTAVRWLLDVKQAFKDSDATFEGDDGVLISGGLFDELGFEDRMFNLTEDHCVHERGSDGIIARLLPDRLEVSLLHAPLPRDLPTVQKNLLIVMAAYHGDVDRYTRTSLMSCFRQ